VSSRKEQKEALRRERLERERQAQEAQRRKRLVGFGIGGALVLAAVVVLAVVLVIGSGGSSGEASSDVLPDGGEVPAKQTADLQEAVSASGCELKSRRVKNSEQAPGSAGFHYTDINKPPTDPWNPPAAGGHYPEWADDGAYSEAPPTSKVVHAAEHGRVTIWFKPSLPEEARANLKAFFDDDSYQMLLVPRPDMPYEVAATAWNRDPAPNGAGRLLGCPKYSGKVFDALRAFREAHRSNGPEPVP
jgi:Protein of unknown function (DUF3105)